MHAIWPVVWALTPTIVLGILFWYVLRIILHADRKERATFDQIEAEERARFKAERGDVNESSRANADKHGDAGSASAHS